MKSMKKLKWIYQKLILSLLVLQIYIGAYPLLRINIFKLHEKIHVFMNKNTSEGMSGLVEL